MTAKQRTLRLLKSKICENCYYYHVWPNFDSQCLRVVDLTERLALPKNLTCEHWESRLDP
jgi:hypothetical protein